MSGITELQRKELIERAKKARMRAYAPYSHFFVGAALLCEDGSIYDGCNIENASYPAGNCAERTAIFKAVSEGKRSFVALALAGGKENEDIEACMPCGICRQVMSEFFDEKVEILCALPKDKFEKYTFSEIFPKPFSLS